MSEELGVTTKRDEDFSKWYLEVVRKGGFIDQRSPVKGFDVITPWGYAVWELIQQRLDAEFKKNGVQNAYFPLLIPESLVRKEEDHFEGFKAEAMAVTEAGGEELDERLYVRPTSETIMYYMYSLWIRSHRDLPLLINQWTNVVRHDTKQTRPFIRGREFLWQEGHTCHASREESDEWLKTVVKMYDSMYDMLAMDRLLLVRPEHDTFPGADYSVVFDTLSQDGRVVQGPGSHNLGQNFSKPFGIKFLDEDGKEKHVWQTSWGTTTRQIGILIMHHGDDRGAVLPPAVAPIQAVIVPVPKKGLEKGVDKFCRSVEKKLGKAGIRCSYDDSDYSPGFKFNKWELKGVPLRIEIGPKEISDKKLTVVRRLDGKKESMKADAKKLRNILDDVQKSMLDRSRKALKKAIKDVTSLDELSALKGIARAGWCGSEKCAEEIESVMEIRGTLYGKEEKGKCVVCGKSGEIVYLAKAY